MVSVSCFKVVFRESDVGFRRVVVFARNGGLVNYRWLQAVSVEWASVLLSAVACLVFSVSGCGGVIGLSRRG